MAVNCNQSKLIESVSVRDTKTEEQSERLKKERKMRKEGEGAEKIKLDSGSGGDWLSAAVYYETAKLLFDGGLHFLHLSCLPVSPS